MTTATSEPTTLKQYFAAEGSRFTNKDATILGPWLSGLGRVCNDEIVEAARDEASPAHPYFEWSDTRCGVYYRRLQAGNMVRSIQVRIIGASGNEHQVRSMQHVPVTVLDKDDTRKGDNGHVLQVIVPTEEVRSNEPQRATIMARIAAEVRCFRKKMAMYRDVLDTPSMAGLFDILDQIEVDVSAADQQVV